MSDRSDNTAIEQRALKLGMASNLLLGIAGVVTSVLSNSQAILVDGLFSMVGFFAAAIAIRVTARAQNGPDRVRPLGYAMDEAIFSTFRAFILFGLVVFAGVNAAVKITAYANGAVPDALNLGPIGFYLVGVMAISGGMWWVLRRAWTKTGRQSDVLRLEATAVAFDALMTAATGVGFGLIYLLQDGPWGVLTPVGDSIIVLGLCGLAAASYFSDFRRGLGELAGVTADPALVLTAGRIVRNALSGWDGRLVDVSVLKAGRTLTVIAYVDPANAIDGTEADDLTRNLAEALAEMAGQVDAVVVISSHGRGLPGSRI